jgi:hypothetical protein
MHKNPLDHIKIASPCSADWDEMLGDTRKRFCTDCKLNVYNLSEMTQKEAERFLFEAEGRVCVRLYKRQDGAVITQDCPVGWAAIKRKVSRVATAIFSLVVSFFGGIFAVSNMVFDNSKLLEEITVESEKPNLKEIIAGEMENLDEIKATEKQPSKKGIDFTMNGGVSNMNELMWIFTERYPK